MSAPTISVRFTLRNATVLPKRPSTKASTVRVTCERHECWTSGTSDATGRSGACENPCAELACRPAATSSGWHRHDRAEGDRSTAISRVRGWLQLTIASRQPLPSVRPVKQIDIDILGKDTGQTRVPGPLADPGAAQVWKVDPRGQA